MCSYFIVKVYLISLPKTDLVQTQLSPFGKKEKVLELI